MNEIECPIHYGSCLLRGNLDPMHPPQIYTDFRNIGLQSLIDLEDVVYVWKVREFHQEFLLTGVNSPDTWGNEIRVSFAVNQVAHNMSTSEFGEMMGILPTEDDFQFYTNTLKFSDEVIDEGDEETVDLLNDILKTNKVNNCLRRKRVTIHDLKDDLMVYYRVLRENVTCRDMFFRMNGQPNPNDVMVIEALMLNWILKGKRFDMGYIMASVIQGARLVYPNAPLPYGMRLTRLFRRLDVLPSEEVDPALVISRIPLI